MQSTAIILKTKAHGESAFVVTAFSGELGKVRGLVRGGRKKRVDLEICNIVNLEQTRRLETQLGTLKIEPVFSPSSTLFSDHLRLQVLHYLAEVLDKVLQEEQPHHKLFSAAEALLCSLKQGDLWQRITFFELQLLASVGFGLSLNEAEAVRGEGDNSPLTFVSPKSGRAVSLTKGQPYAAQMFRLPTVLGGEKLPENVAEMQDFIDVFSLSGHFLSQAVHGSKLEARDTLLKLGEEERFSS